MKNILSLCALLLVLLPLHLCAQDEVSLFDFYLSAGYKNQPYHNLNKALEDNGYESFNSNVGTLGGGFSYLPNSGFGFFGETQLNINRKGFSNDKVKYRYLPVHFTAGLQYHFLNPATSEWRIYPKLGFYFGSTSLDLISTTPNRDFDENLLGAMNTSFLYQENFGLDVSVNVDKLIGSFLQPVTQVGIYSRLGLQVGYMVNLLSSRTKLRRNFNATVRDDFAIRNSPTFNPSAFYAKVNLAIGKFTKSDRD